MIKLKKDERYLKLQPWSLQCDEIVTERFENTYDMINYHVEGLIERLPYFQEFNERDIDIWINEEGKLINLPPTAVVVDKESQKILDVIHGSWVFAKHDGSGETVPLNAKEQQFILCYFATKEIVYLTDKRTGKKKEVFKIEI
jgi:hypothetical protein